MSHVFTGLKSTLLSTFIAGGDIRAKLLMSNTTADTQQDAMTLADISTLDEYDGAGYAEAVLTGESVEKDDAANRGEFHVDPFNFGANVSAGSRQAVGMLVYKRVSGAPASDLVMFYFDGAPFPFAGTGGPVNVTPDVQGVLQAT